MFVFQCFGNLQICNFLQHLQRPKLWIDVVFPVKFCVFNGLCNLFLHFMQFFFFAVQSTTARPQRSTAPRPPPPPPAARTSSWGTPSPSSPPSPPRALLVMVQDDAVVVGDTAGITAGELLCGESGRSQPCRAFSQVLRHRCLLPPRHSSPHGQMHYTVLCQWKEYL